VKVFWK